MHVVGLVFHYLYFLLGLSSLLGVTVILHRLGFGKPWIAAPTLATLIFTLVTVLLANITILSATGSMDFMIFGFAGTWTPALELVPPIFVVVIALSRRLPLDQWAPQLIRKFRL